MFLACPILAATERPAPDAKPAAGGVRRIVLDPGHGGSEQGAQGPGGALEKELTLDISRRVAALLRADGFEVTLTRDGDEDVVLYSRAGVANNAHADLFISVHANASRFAVARGAETYVLSPEATDDNARTTAALENDAVGVKQAAPEGDADLPMILWDLAQVQYLQESMRLAGVVQAKLNAALGLKDRGVRQAPFAVLRGATMPAVLVELGFITNPDEEKLLTNPDHRRKLAEALADAVRQFRADVARGSAP
jgi:N-acetylmuramoyl-L-alanine amidase